MIGVVWPPGGCYLLLYLHPMLGNLVISSLTSATGIKALSLSFSLARHFALEWLKMSERDGFEEFCACLASLKLIPRPPGLTFLLLSSQNSVLYFSELF